MTVETAQPAAKDYATEYTTKELIAAFISHEIKDGERIAAGAGLHVPRAGVLLAHLTHAPNSKAYFVMVYSHLRKEPTLEPVYTVTDWRPAKFAEAFAIHSEWMDRIRFISDTFFVGGIQIDKYGNSNLIGVGDDYKHLKFRGPGAVGTPSMADHMDRYYLYLNTHDKRTLVDRCDFISTFGWGKGGKDARMKLGIPGGGPKYCITNLAILDFEEETKQMRLKSVHPGVTVDQVVANTGFELIIPGEVPTTELPTEEEILVLRNRIDVDKMLQR